MTDPAAHERALDRIQTHMPGGKEADAQADANLAAKDGEFGLIMSRGRFVSLPAGAICFTPGGQPPAILTSVGYGDVVTPEISARLAYGAAYNRALVDQASYPFRDLCRPSTSGDNELRAEDRSRVTKPAREITGPPRDLFDAARRGSARDIWRVRGGSSIDAADGVGMTALAWAVARNNRPAIGALLLAGANPWVAGRNGMNGPFGTAVFWAAALGRGDAFSGLASRPGRPFDQWPSTYLSAAMDGGDRSILEQMLGEPHEGARIELLRRPLPDAALFELILKQQPDLADPLLFMSLDHSDERPELTRLALAHGANVNALRSYETPLAKVSAGISAHSPEAMEMLLKAGADPNLMSHRTRPIWEAFGNIKLDESGRHWTPTGLPRRKFNRLLAAGADLNLPNWQGLPPIWFLLFPYSYDYAQLDASLVTPELIEMAARKGLDVNAEWNGKRVLGPVEAQAGRDSELATTLRRLGAKR